MLFKQCKLYLRSCTTIPVLPHVSSCRSSETLEATMTETPKLTKTPPTLKPQTEPFTHVRLSKSTFRITQINQKNLHFPARYGESVHIYVRIKNQALFVIDTGFGGVKEYIFREVLTGDLAWAKTIPIYVIVRFDARFDCLWQWAEGSLPRSEANN